MSRTLVLVRHAKAEQGSPDRSRALSKRGTADARAIGAWLRDRGIVPDVALVSPARRTTQTWELARKAAASNAETVYDERVWDNSVEDVTAAIGAQPEAVQTLVVVGHNPSMHALAASYGEVGEFPTAAVAVVEVGGWDRLEDGRLVAVAVCRG